MPREWEANVGTTDKAVDLLWHGLAANTRQVYRAGQATYARFASSQGFKLFSIQFEALAQIIATSAEETLTETTKSYISHLRNYHIDKGGTQIWQYAREGEAGNHIGNSTSGSYNHLIHTR